MKTCNWFNKWYLWNINLVFINGTLQKWHNSLIILSYLAVFTIIEFLLSGQKFISTLLSDILTILGIIWACKVFLDCFYNYLKKQPSSQVEKIYVKTSFNIGLTVCWKSYICIQIPFYLLNNSHTSTLYRYISNFKYKFLFWFVVKPC